MKPSPRRWPTRRLPKLLLRLRPRLQQRLLLKHPPKRLLLLPKHSLQKFTTHKKPETNSRDYDRGFRLFMCHCVNIILYRFAFGHFVSYLCNSKGSAHVLPFFHAYVSNHSLSNFHPLKGGFPTLRKGPNDTLRVALLLYRLGYLTNESCNF